jgi:urease accessory protein
MLRAVSHVQTATGRGIDTITLAHDERRLRRKLLRTDAGQEVMVDLPQTVTLDAGAALVLDDNRQIVVQAANEDVHVVTAASPADLLKLAWHIGNRHTPAQVLADRIQIKRDHVLKAMLEGLGATVTERSAPFVPEHGAYHGHSHGTETGHADTAHALLYRK